MNHHIRVIVLSNKPPKAIYSTTVEDIKPESTSGLPFFTIRSFFRDPTHVDKLGLAQLAEWVVDAALPFYGQTDKRFIIELKKSEDGYTAELSRVDKELGRENIERGKGYDRNEAFANLRKVVEEKVKLRLSWQEL